jgi:hypothetical protein
MAKVVMAELASEADEISVAGSNDEPPYSICQGHLHGHTGAEVQRICLNAAAEDDATLWHL